MKSVLCYGDSNVWGYISGTDAERYDNLTRFTGILQNMLGEDYAVIEEGMPGRTCCADDISKTMGNKNGSIFFPQCVYSHLPLDYVVLLLGTNDLKKDLNTSAKDCALAIENKYILPLQAGFDGKIKQIPQIIIIAPAKISDGSWGIFEGADTESKNFNTEYKLIAEKHNCIFVDNANLENGVDKIHLTAQSHKILSQKLFDAIKNDF